MNDTIRLGTWQGPVAENRLDVNIAKVKSVLDESEGLELDFLCFPETFLSGYSDEAIQHSARPLDDPEIVTLIRYTERFDTVVLVGMSEKEGELTYNTQLVIYRGELLGKYRKTMLTGFDKKYFATDWELPVFEAKGVKFGVVTCHSTSFVEPAQYLRWKGVRLLFTPHFNRIKPEGFGWRRGGRKVSFWEHRTKVLNNQAALATLLNMVVVRSNVVGVDKRGLSAGDSNIWDMNGVMVAAGPRSRSVSSRQILRRGSSTKNTGSIWGKCRRSFAKGSHKPRGRTREPLPDVHRAGRESLSCTAIRTASWSSRTTRSLRRSFRRNLSGSATRSCGRCRQIRTISKVPIIFISARDSDYDQVRALENGGDDYITKPVVFLVPFGVGLIHSTFAMKALGTLVMSPVLDEGWLVAASYLLVYSLFFAATNGIYQRAVAPRGIR